MSAFQGQDVAIVSGLGRGGLAKQDADRGVLLTGKNVLPAPGTVGPAEDLL